MSETTISDVALPLSEVYIYDTISDSWSKEVTSGKIPSDRGGFSSILGMQLNKKIIED
ncbi:17787_t:CDS:2 [Rhizophagus irregularis]|nr:17787_t:CDS:2 [Rhizophagus irregularis]